MNTPIYFTWVSFFVTTIFLYIIVPIVLILAAYILLAYSINMLTGDIEPEVKFRRGVALFLPFLISLYIVTCFQENEFDILSKIPFLILLLIGGIIGFFFIYWVSNMKDDEELFVTLSCLVSSFIFFTMLIGFIITESFQIISFVFGLLFGSCVYIIACGFTVPDRFKVPIPQFIKNKLN
ncbi:DUF4956 domain-containing protein [Candidatus Magnetomoraceae bacterium gMMP-1]